MHFIKLAPKRFGAGFCFIENRAISPLTGVLYFFAGKFWAAKSLTVLKHRVHVTAVATLNKRNGVLITAEYNICFLQIIKKREKRRNCARNRI